MIKNLNLSLLTSALLACLSVLPTYENANANDNANSDTTLARSKIVGSGPTDDDIRMQLQFSPEVTSILGPTDDIPTTRGAGAGGAFLYALNGKFAIGSGIRHVVRMGGATSETLFTQFDIRAEFAFNNGLILKREDYNSGRNLRKNHLGGLRLTFAINQYYFIDSVTPFSGPGVGVSHEFYSTPRMNYIVGARMDRITNGIQAIYPTMLTAGIAYRF